MRLRVRLPKVEARVIEVPTACPLRHPESHRRCTGRHFKLH